MAIVLGSARAIGKSLEQLQLDRTGCTVTALRRDGIVGPQPSPETVLRAGDVVALYGTPAALEKGESLVLMGQVGTERPADSVREWPAGEGHRVGQLRDAVCQQPICSRSEPVYPTGLSPSHHLSRQAYARDR